ncbi:mechanosensitive ion channel family protein [Roseivivax isoporae]|uniref:Mechanosensitive ion channel protein MscS n=1 Tax=Roseivivax isoporae LMG 25204 TaxID=1449351 RepID=X7F821_9RHOB|nr:mechanosensitive ion channel family protein [Roseivivax isoporae]ETX29027.1 mechanosensitive ion channel protein MscS [Roseivivax isoporae LMG 25204]
MESARDLWARLAAALDRAPDVVLPLAQVALAVAIALALHRLAFRMALTRIDGRRDMRAALLRRARRPLRLVALLTALLLTLPQVSMAPDLGGAIWHAVLVLVILLIGWTLILITNFVTERSLQRQRLDLEDNLMARKRVTQVRVLRRAIEILLGMVTVAVALMTFESVRRYGVSLFASAGAAGLVLGLAARPVLSNLIAGIQIAITQPIRLEDVVIVENEWGWVEEIFATYVVVRLWDWRRMVVPLSYFIENPFQNWTRETASIIGSVYWYADYTLPVAEMRAKLEEVVEASALWDGKVKVLQVVGTDKDTIHLRGLMSARTSPLNWDLRCEVREKMLDWLQREHPEALPRLRGELSPTPEPAERRAAEPPRPGQETGPDGDGQ